MKRFLLALLALAFSSSAFAQTSAVPTRINYQGRVADASGLAIGNTTPVNRTVVFRIWDSPTATAALNRLYSEQQNVTISAGEFSVLVGAGTSVSGETGNAFNLLNAAVFAGAARYLGITVDDGDGNLANDLEASPRQQIVTSAFAFRAQVAEAVAAGGVASTSLANNAVGSDALAAGAVTATKLGAGAVGSTQLADLGVTAGKLAAGAVTTSALAANAVSASAIADGAIATAKVADSAVTLAKLNADSVNSSKIVDGSIATADLAAGAVDGTKLADAAVSTVKLMDTAVTTAKLTDGAVTLAKHAPNSVDSSKIVDGTIALADLTPSVKDVLPKARAIYNQAVNPTVDGSNWALVPIDLGELGNDVDGCRLQIIAMHKTELGWMTATDMFLWVQEAGFTNVGATDFNANRRWVYAKWTNSGTVGAASTLLPPSTISAQGGNFATVTVNGGDWVRFYNFYPGSLRSGDSNRENNASTPQGPVNAITLNITSIVAGTNKLTITVDNAHAIQVGDSVTLAGITGSPSAIGTKTVTTQSDRMSFEVALTGAAGGYSGGTVTYTPSFNRYRIWAAVHPNHSMRFIVNDR